MRKAFAEFPYGADPPLAVQWRVMPARLLEMIGACVKPQPERSTAMETLFERYCVQPLVGLVPAQNVELMIGGAAIQSMFQPQLVASLGVMADG